MADGPRRAADCNEISGDRKRKLWWNLAQIYAVCDNRLLLSVAHDWCPHLQNDKENMGNRPLLDLNIYQRRRNFFSLPVTVVLVPNSACMRNEPTCALGVWRPCSPQKGHFEVQREISLRSI